MSNIIKNPFRNSKTAGLVPRKMPNMSKIGKKEKKRTYESSWPHENEPCEYPYDESYQLSPSDESLNGIGGREGSGREF